MDDLRNERDLISVAEPWILRTRWRRACIALAFTLVPFASFVAADSLLAPEWQDPSAEWTSVFADEARGPFETISLVVFGLGMALIAFIPSDRHRPHGTAVLLGAAILSSFYAVTLTIASSGATLLFAVSLAFVALAVEIASRVLNAVVQRAFARGLGLGEAGLALVLGLIAVAMVPPLQRLLLAIAMWVVLSIFGSGPFLCLAIALRLAFDQFDARDRRHILPSLTAIGVAIASIYVTWQRAMEHHASLSPIDPYTNCYVASAAAHGHRAVVGSWSAPTAAGTITVTRQLVQLKSVELLVRSASPRLHRLIRFGYDRIGPSLARRITSPVRADLAWLSMLPLGLAARLVLASMPAPARTRVARLHPPADHQPPTNR